MTAKTYETPTPDDTFDTLAKGKPGYGRPKPPSHCDAVPVGLFDAARGLRFQPVGGSAGPRGPILQGNGPTFSVSRFADQIRTRLSGKAKGWAFAINTNGSLAEEDAGGDARSPAEGNLDMTANRRLNIASVSKPVTAIAVLRLLEQLGLSPEDKIWPFLPDSWTLGPGITGLRFRDLMRHESGLTSMNSSFSTTLSYAGLATAIQTGGAAGSPYNYLNADYALFRVIIPAMWSQAGLPTANNDNDVASAFFYVVYLIEEVFARMGGAIGQNASTSELDANPTRYYDTAASSTGISMGNWALIAGGGGWHLSARELAAILANMTYNDDVLSPAARAQMDSLSLGWFPLGSTSGQYGQYYGHNGVIGGGGGRVRTAVAKFSIQCEASLVANSAIAGYGDPLALLIDAFDDAWQ